MAEIIIVSDDEDSDIIEIHPNGEEDNDVQFVDYIAPQNQERVEPNQEAQNLVPIDDEVQEIENPNGHRNMAQGLDLDIVEIEDPNPEVHQNPEAIEAQNPADMAPAIPVVTIAFRRNPEAEPEDDSVYDLLVPTVTKEQEAIHSRRSLRNVRNDKEILAKYNIKASGEPDVAEPEANEESEEVDDEDIDGDEFGLDTDPDEERRKFDEKASEWSWMDRFRALGIKDPGPDWVPKKPLRDEPSMTFTEYKLLAKKDDRLYRYINTEWQPNYLDDNKDRVIRFKMDFSGLEPYTPQMYRWIRLDEKKARRAAMEKEMAKQKKEDQRKRRNARARELLEMKKKGIVVPKRARKPTVSSGPKAKKAREAEPPGKVIVTREQRAERRKNLKLNGVDTSRLAGRRRDPESEFESESDSSVSRSRSSKRRQKSSTEKRQSSPDDPRPSTGFRNPTRASRSRNPGTSEDDEEDDPNVPGPSSAIHKRRR